MAASKAIEAMETDETTASSLEPEPGGLLLGWLGLMGWGIRIEQGEQLRAVAEHTPPAGAPLVVTARGTELAELSWELFSGAVAALESERPPSAEPVAA